MIPQYVLRGKLAWSQTYNEGACEKNNNNKLFQQDFDLSCSFPFLLGCQESIKTLPKWLPHFLPLLALNTHSVPCHGTDTSKLYQSKIDWQIFTFGHK